MRESECSYRSIFGVLSSPRAYYHAAGSVGTFPVDGDLNLPDRGYSYLLKQFYSRLSVAMSYDDAQVIMNPLFPVKKPIRSMESIAGDLCEEMDRFYEEQTSPEARPVLWRR